MKRGRRSTAFDYTGPLVLPAYAHESRSRKQRTTWRPVPKSHASSQVPAARRPTAQEDAMSQPVLRKPPPAAPARLAVQRVWDRAQYAWPRVKQALEHEYDLVFTEAGNETADLVILSSKQGSPLWGERGTERQREVMRECNGAVFEKHTGRAVCVPARTAYYASDQRDEHAAWTDGCLLQLFSWRGKWHVYIRWPHAHLG